MNASGSASTYLVGSCMSTQQVLTINIVTVRPCTTGMILGYQQIIKVLLYCYDWIQVIENAKYWISFRVDEYFIEIVDNLLTYNRQGMVFLKVQASVEVGGYLWGNVGPVVDGVFFVV